MSGGLFLGLLILGWLIFGGPNKYKVTWPALLMLCLALAGCVYVYSGSVPNVRTGLPDSGPERKIMMDNWGKP